MVCQNQNIASSNADLAKDLRQQVYTHIKKGQSDEEIIAFMVARYGEFVLYRPRLNARTALLWLGPFVLLVGGMFLMIRLMRRTRDGDAPISEGSMNRARDLLKKNSKTP
jgi:cytochrome c-type biogenesis protein CcmH